MDVDVLQEQITDVVTQYGRPPSAASHLEKLGEEYGELAAAVALNKNGSTIADEIADMICVLTSMMSILDKNLQKAVLHKLATLETRMAHGRYDRKYGHGKKEVV